MELIEAKFAVDIEFCKAIILAFRTNLNENNYLAQITEMMVKEQFKLVYIPDVENKSAAAFIGYRRQMMLRTGPIIYIDDLFTADAYRGKGYAKALLDYVKQEAIGDGLAAVHLDSGYSLHTAHQLYLNSGYTLACHHFVQEIESAGIKV